MMQLQDRYRALHAALAAHYERPVHDDTPADRQLGIALKQQLFELTQAAARQQQRLVWRRCLRLWIDYSGCHHDLALLHYFWGEHRIGRFIIRHCALNRWQ